jgi:AraC-like DNA-binding protein
VIATSGLDELLAAPGGRYMSGPFSISFIADPSLVGVLVWGRPTTEQILELVRAHEKMRPVLAARTSALVDVRHLEWPDPGAFSALVGYLVERRDWLAEYIERLALVRAGLGPVGAASAGFFDVSPRPFAVETFTDLPGALRWVDRSDAAELEAELESLFAEASGVPELLRKLRAVLEARPGALSLGAAARAVGATERSLQRRLKSWATAFQTEQNRAQVKVAERLLVESDAPLGQIAADVGCATVSHFSALFRRVTGETPSDFRSRRRR